MAPERDHYAAYYADKLWALLPAVYRSLDSASIDASGPLRELVNRIGAQAAILRRGVDRLWEDQSIETCDDWLIPYLGDLLATNLVPSLDARGQRLDVAKTIYYRRRAGTVAILEEIASDITGWDARVLEFFRRVGRTRHGLDPELGLPAETDDPEGQRRLQLAEGLIGPWTGTPMGGTADLRNRYGASKAHSPFDEFFHTADLRRGQGQLGWHNIPRLGVFLWRLVSFGVDPSTPVPVRDCPGQFSFDPTGRDTPLFAAAASARGRFGDTWVSPQEWQLPTRIAAPLLETELAQLYDAETTPHSFGVYRRPLADYELVDASSPKIDPERGRVTVTGALPGELFVAYHYGFSSTIGAGPYDRFVSGISPIAQPDPVTSVRNGDPLPTIAGTGTLTLLDSLTYESVSPLTIQAMTIRAASGKRPIVRLPVPSPRVFEWIMTGAEGSSLALEGLFVSGGDIVLRGDFDSVVISCSTLDPGTAGAQAVDGRELRPVTLWIEGNVRILTIDRSIVGPIRTRNGGSIEKLAAANSILQGIRTSAFGAFTAHDIADPGGLANALQNTADPLAVFLVGALTAATRALLEAYGSGVPAVELVDALLTDLDAILPGPSLYDAPRFRKARLSPETFALLALNPSGVELVRLNRRLLEEAYPVELGQGALASHDGTFALTRCTVMGEVHAHRFDASESILDGRVYVDDTQAGCVRFSAWVSDSVIPRQYESVEVPPAAPLFLSRAFGQPEYAQLTPEVDTAILVPAGGTIAEGAEDGSEMGAFARDKNPIKLRSLLIKFDEYMPLGLVPVIVPVT